MSNSPAPAEDVGDAPTGPSAETTGLLPCPLLLHHSVACAEDKDASPPDVKDATPERPAETGSHTTLWDEPRSPKDAESSIGLHLFTTSSSCASVSSLFHESFHARTRPVNNKASDAERHGQISGATSRVQDSLCS